MEVKEAVRAAKNYVMALFADENPVDVMLEEVSFQQETGQWLVTIGFSRLGTDEERMGPRLRFPAPRTMKVITIGDQDQRVVSVRNREWAE